MTFRAAARLVLGRPRWWTLALAGFLARGGIVAFALTILSLPSVVGLTTFVGPTAVTAAGLSPRFVGLLAAAAGIALVGLLVGLVVGSVVDVALIRATVGLDGDPDGPGARDPRLSARADLPRLVGRLVVARLLALLPLAVVTAWGAARLVEVGYRELVLPGDLARPFVLRVLDGAPDVVAAIVGAWLVVELAGATAVRLIVVDNRSVLAGLGGALRHLVRSPFRTSAVMVASMLASLLMVAPALIAVGLAWRMARMRLLDQSASPLSAVSLSAVLLLLALWLAALLLAGVTAAWRSVCWTVVLRRGRSSADGGEPLALVRA